MKSLSVYVLLFMGLSVSTVGYASIPLSLYLSGNPAAQTLTSAGGNAGDGSYSVANSVIGTFSDKWNFTLAGNTDVDASVVAINSIIPAKINRVTQVITPSTTINITEGSLGFQLERQVAANIWNNVSSVFGPGSSETYDSLVSGSYRFLVTGTVNGTSGKGSYGFNVNVYDAVIDTITSVPTPETWAMLLTGALLLGVQMHRKSTDQDAMLMAA